MNWIAFSGTLGLGAILTKLLDFWLARMTREAEHRKWLRDQRLAAYADVARDFLSFGFSRGAQFQNPFEAYAVIAKAWLLVHDDDLANEMDVFIVKLDRFFEVQNQENADHQQRPESEELYNQLNEKSRNIIRLLRVALTTEG
jgi:hypothetical protein